MYELIKAGEKTYYINCPAKMGIYEKSSDEVYLIDSGNDKEAGKKVLKIFAEQNWTIKAIINTHSNADHIGGNKVISERTGCKVFANKIEAAFTRYPILEPSFLFGGFPPEALHNKFMTASPSDAADLSVDISDGSFPTELEIIPLEGHFFDMIGIRTPDNVAFLADCMFSRSILEKYHVSFIYDVEKFLSTLEKVKEMTASLFVPSHAEATDNIKMLADQNITKVHEIEGKILSICKSPVCFEDILQKLFFEYNLTMDFNQYVLVGSTVRSYLSYMEKSGKLIYEFIDNKLLWSDKR